MCARVFRTVAALSGIATFVIVLYGLLAFPAFAQSASAPVSAPNPGRAEYLLGPGDQIRISVFQNPDLAVETRVSETGTITFPLIGTVQVGGMTPAQAEQRIANQLRSGKFVLQPQVTVLVLTVRGSQIAVLGQVNRPGRYPIEVTNTRVSDVLALAGGIMPSGSDMVTIVGKRNSKDFTKEIDVAGLFQSGKIGEDMLVEGGDVIYAHRAPQFFIYGEVQRPGVYRLERTMTVMQALAQGGGLTPRGTERGLRLNRRDSSGRLQSKEPSMDEIVMPDDVLNVRQSIF
jgi:polysaccharide biosynthesis/export protein